MNILFVCHSPHAADSLNKSFRGCGGGIVMAVIPGTPLLGARFDRIYIVPEAHDLDSYQSETKRKAVDMWFTEVLPCRLRQDGEMVWM